jgi:hypothetical protein
MLCIARGKVQAKLNTYSREGGRTVVSNAAAATVTDAWSVADGGIDGPPPQRVSPMQNPACWKREIAIKTEPRILVFRHST